MTDLPDLSDLLRLREGLSIVHHIPGRIRLRLGPIIQEWAAMQELTPDQAVDWLDTVPGINGIRLNAAAASLIIAYDPERLDPDWWETLILGDEDMAAALVLGLFTGT